MPSHRAIGIQKLAISVSFIIAASLFSFSSRLSASNVGDNTPAHLPVHPAMHEGAFFTIYRLNAPSKTVKDINDYFAYVKGEVDNARSQLHSQLSDLDCTIDGGMDFLSLILAGTGATNPPPPPPPPPYPVPSPVMPIEPGSQVGSPQYEGGIDHLLKQAFFPASSLPKIEDGSMLSTICGSDQPSFSLAVHCPSDVVGHFADFKKTTMANQYQDCQDIKCNLLWGDHTTGQEYVGRLNMLTRVPSSPASQEVIPQ